MSDLSHFGFFNLMREGETDDFARAGRAEGSFCFAKCGTRGEDVVKQNNVFPRTRAVSLRQMSRGDFAGALSCPL